MARRIEATEDVSLAELSPASVSAVDRPAHATDPTEDISLQDVSLARPEVANDTELAAPAPHNAPGKSGRASADLAPGRGSKRWLWALGAAALLLGAGFFVRASRMADDLGKRQQVSVGEPRALDTGASTDSRAAAAGKAPIPVPSAPERTLAPAVNAAPLLPALAPEVDSNPALQAAEPSVGATAAASEHEGAAGIEAAGPDESGAEDLKAVEAADAKAAEAADAKGVGAEDGEELGTEGVEELDSARLAAIKRADGLVSQASALRRRRKFAPARSKYRAALVAYPDHPRALYGLAQVAIQQHDGRQAVQLALELVQTKPDQVSYLVLLGDAYKAAGKLKDAREAWQSAARKGSPVARKRLK